MLEGHTVVYDEFTRARADAKKALLSALEERILILSNPARTQRRVRADPVFRAILTSNREEYAGAAGRAVHPDPPRRARIPLARHGGRGEASRRDPARRLARGPAVSAAEARAAALPDAETGKPLTLVEAAGALDADRGLARLARETMAALGLRPGVLARIEGARVAHLRIPPARGGAAGRAAPGAALAEDPVSEGDVVAAPTPGGRRVWVEVAALSPGPVARLLSGRGAGGRGSPLCGRRRPRRPDRAGARDGRAADPSPRPLRPARRRAVAGGAEAVDAAALWIEQAHIDAARAHFGPSALRKTRLELPETRWSDIGGLAEAKAALVEAMIWPMRHAEALRQLGIAPLSGLLLGGPLAGGKTLLARALAAESGARFIAARGAQILSRFLGDAERAVAELFDKARHAAPCILFCDELDVLAPARGAADPALERVVGQLLVEIDGVAASRGVFVLGATNRAEAIDAALLRPGRLEHVLTLPPPDAAARREIRAVHSAGAPLSAEVDLDALAEAARGFSGAELRALRHEDARRALRRALRSGAALDGDALAVTPLDFDAAFRCRRPETAP
jgi:AAA+ superfamily predicted ATPase